jgi:hypothetical protein
LVALVNAALFGRSRFLLGWLQRVFSNVVRVVVAGWKPLGWRLWPISMVEKCLSWKAMIQHRVIDRQVIERLVIKRQGVKQRVIKQWMIKQRMIKHRVAQQG